MSDFDPLDFARQNIGFHTDKNWPDEFKGVNYVLRGNGLWEVRQNSIGTFWVHRYRGKLGGFPAEDQKEHFELTLPKIPRRLLNQAIAFFRKLSDDHEFESYVQFFWDIDNKVYHVVVPEQRVSQGRVEYDKSNEDARKQILVCEVHSHNTMDAFFSPTDDRDEKKRGDRFFGVVGRLDQGIPEMKLSYIMGGGKRVYIEVDQVFDTIDFPQEWLQQVVYLDREPNEELYGTLQESEEESDVESNGEVESDNWVHEYRAAGNHLETTGIGEV